MLCINCKKRPVLIRKRGLCAACYQAYRKEHGPFLRDAALVSHERAVKAAEKDGEINFVRNYFDHDNWIFQPAKFRLNGNTYTPDFYDARRNVFIEVSRTKQAYHQNKDKYELFRKSFPGLCLEIRTPSGELLSETYGERWTGNNG